MSLGLIDDDLAVDLARYATPTLLGHYLTDGAFKLYRYSLLIGEALRDCALTPDGRLIVTVPPQHGKSTLASVFLPTWYLHLFPWANVQLASYGDRLARRNSRDVRNLVRDHPDKLRVRLAKDSTAADRWNTPEGGGMISVGVGGGLTGFGADLGVLDDLLKDFADAHSPTIRQKVWDWYLTVPYTRRRPGASIIVVMTRWHEDDPVGRLREEMKEGTGEDWVELRIPAVAEDPGDPYWLDHADEWVDDPLGREPGEVIEPQRYDRASVEQTMKTMGPYKSAGMYQQRPAPLEGTWFKRHNWSYGERPSAGDVSFLVRAWDTAATEDSTEADWTVGVLMALWDGLPVVVDVVRDQLGPDGVEALVASTAATDGAEWGARRVLQRFEQEPGSAGKILVRHWDKLLRGYRTKAELSTGSKFVRAQPYQAAQNRGEVRLCRTKVGGDAPWWPDWVEEHAVFPQAGAHDDQVDAGALAYAELEGREHTPTKVTSVAGRSIGTTLPMGPRRR